MSNFKNDLKNGQKYEVIARDYFKYKKCFAPRGKFKEYDFILDDKIKVEVKSDYIAYRTGNVVIEYMCNNIDSGINATTADYWIYFVINSNDYDVYKISTFKLKKICDKYGRKIRGGDGRRSCMYLLKICHLEKYIIIHPS